MRLSFALVDRKYLFAKFRCEVFHQCVAAQFNGIVLTQLKQIGFHGICVAVVDAHFGDDVHIDFANWLAVGHLVGLHQQHAFRACGWFEKAIGTATQECSAEAGEGGVFVHSDFG